MIPKALDILGGASVENLTKLQSEATKIIGEAEFTLRKWHVRALELDDVNEELTGMSFKVNNKNGKYTWNIMEQINGYRRIRFNILHQGIWYPNQEKNNIALQVTVWCARLGSTYNNNWIAHL